MSEIETTLSQFVTQHGGVSGTIHRREGELLKLMATVKIPPKVLELIQVIPKGKGMAGLALEREQPVQTCNLKDDTTGDVRPGAKAVDATAAVAFPIASKGGDIDAIVGIAFMDYREFTDQQMETYATAANDLFAPYLA